MGYRVLIVDDEKDIIDLISIYLEKDGYSIGKYYNGATAWEAFQKNKYDIAIIDIMMPEINGFELIKKIRSISKIPLIFLSARNMSEDKILGLGLGADDYITKPFNPLELVARIEANIRRFYKLNERIDVDDYLHIGKLKLYINKGVLLKNDKSIELTISELRILEMLMKNPSRVFTKKQLFEYIRDDKFYDSDDNTIMVHISNLRNKIEDNPKKPEYIKTIRGLGYKIEKV